MLSNSRSEQFFFLPFNFRLMTITPCRLIVETKQNHVIEFVILILITVLLLFVLDYCPIWE